MEEQSLVKSAEDEKSEQLKIARINPKNVTTTIAEVEAALKKQESPPPPQLVMSVEDALSPSRAFSDIYSEVASALYGVSDLTSDLVRMICGFARPPAIAHIYVVQPTRQVMGGYAPGSYIQIRLFDPAHPQASTTKDTSNPEAVVENYGFRMSLHVFAGTFPALPDSASAAGSAGLPVQTLVVGHYLYSVGGGAQQQQRSVARLDLTRVVSEITSSVSAGAGGGGLGGALPEWQWEQLSNMPEPRQSHMLVAWRDSIIVFGGWFARDGDAGSETYRYHIPTNTWSKVVGAEWSRSERMALAGVCYATSLHDDVYAVCAPSRVYVLPLRSLPQPRTSRTDQPPLPPPPVKWKLFQCELRDRAETPIAAGFPLHSSDCVCPHAPAYCKSCGVVVWTADSKSWQLDVSARRWLPQPMSVAYFPTRASHPIPNDYLLRYQTALEQKQKLQPPPSPTPAQFDVLSARAEWPLELSLRNGDQLTSTVDVSVRSIAARLLPRTDWSGRMVTCIAAAYDSCKMGEIDQNFSHLTFAEL